MNMVEAASNALPAETIQMAAGDGDFEAVKLFVQNGVSVNEQDEYGYSPLHAACSYGNVEIAQWLIEHGANVSLQDFEGDTPLAVCENTVCADLLLSQGADIFSVNQNNATPYHIAVWECRQEMIDWLTEQYNQRNIPLPEVGENPEDDDDGGDDENFGGDEEEDDDDGMQEGKN